MRATRSILGATILASFALLAFFGCSSSPKQASDSGSTAAPASPPQSVPDLRSAANCIVSTMQNPKEPFHLSLSRKDDDVPYLFTSDADFTADTLEGTSIWKSGPDATKISNIHSDSNAWDASVMLLAAPLTTAAINDFLAAQSTATSAGPDPVGGYDAIKYVFDTSRLSPADKLRFTAQLKAQDFSVTGTAWITKDTHCMVKFVTDYKFTAKDGTVGSVHNEGALDKK